MSAPVVVKNADGFPILGWLINWSTDRGFAISRSSMQTALQKVGIDPKFAAEILAKNAATRAVRDATKGNKDKMHRKVADQDEVAAFVIADTTVDSDFNADFNVVTKAQWDKTNRVFKVTGNSKTEIEKNFEENKVVYASDQFRSIILRYAERECACIAYLETGNIYFVPVSKKQELRKLENLFKELGTGVKLRTKEEVSTKAVRSVMWDVTINEMRENFKNLQKDFEELDDTITPKMLETRLNRYKELKVKGEMFASVLEGSAKDMQTDLDKLSALVKKKLVE